jgi:hypothetical protein
MLVDLHSITDSKQVTACALQDWIQARRLDLHMQHLLKGNPTASVRTEPAPASEDTTVCQNGSSSQRASTMIRHPPDTQLEQISWTCSHSHFALMGGIAIDFTKTSINPLPSHISGARLLLKPAGVCKIAEYEPALFNGLTTEWIEDKSKADGFAKILVCVQATWFLVQTVGRLAAQFPISILELNTAAHAVCCLANYVAWWHKPLDITQPYVINVMSERAQNICAWIIMQSVGKWPRYFGDHTTWMNTYHGVDGRPQYCETSGEHGTFELQYEGSTTHDDRRRIDVEIECLDKIKNSDWTHVWRLTEGDMVHGFRLKIVNTHGSRPMHIWTEVGPRYIECFRLAQNFKKDNVLDETWSGESPVQHEGV